MYMYCLKQVNILVVPLNFIYNTSQYASFPLLNLHSLTFRHNRALIAQIIIIQNIMLPENVSCLRFLNCFANSLIYSNPLIVSVLHGQRTLHCGVAIQNMHHLGALVYSISQFRKHHVSGVGWKCEGISKAPPLHSAGTDLCYCKNQLIRAVTPPGSFATFYK